jgi:hypothetical protein
LPSESTATPLALLNLAAVPKPFVTAAVPSPAIVVTKPVGSIERRRLLFMSATMTLPVREYATWDGQLKDACVPAPSAQPAAPLPARVDTAPSGATSRTRALL